MIPFSEFIEMDAHTSLINNQGADAKQTSKVLDRARSFRAGHSVITQEGWLDTHVQVST